MAKREDSTTGLTSINKIKFITALSSAFKGNEFMTRCMYFQVHCKVD